MEKLYEKPVAELIKFALQEQINSVFVPTGSEGTEIIDPETPGGFPGWT